MPCYHPIEVYRKKGGRLPSGKWPIVFDKRDAMPGYPSLQIPCGRCIGCRLEYSRQWAIRCVHEAKMHDKNCFLTLTYNNASMESKCRLEDESDKTDRTYSLNKRDIILFIKRLRQNIVRKHLERGGKGGVSDAPRIRYYQCGEYGEEGSRPHHHMCIFGFDFEDKKIWSVRQGVPLYRSEELEDLWGLGYCTIGNVTWESAAYVARYVTKKITGDRAEDHYDGRQPEYVTMSRRPGLGIRWLKEYQNDVYPKDQLVIRDKLIVRPPRYYNRIYDVIRPNQYKLIKERRIKKQWESRADNSRERLLVKETVKRAQMARKKRGFENGTSILHS